MRRQHLCQSSRFFTPVDLIGDYTERGADGELTKNVWVACEEWGRADGKRTCLVTADYDKQDVELMPCESYERQVISSRAMSERGVHPGEDPLGQPKDPH